jgi:cytochrome oxidase Cu insertion factor (SCO1/SenC/PrrC family)
MTNQEGKPFTAQQLLGKWALMDFGSIHSADVKGINSVCRWAGAQPRGKGWAG